MPQQRFRATVLRRDEQPRHVYEYYVTGSGDFPFDMLRYDVAWPADTTSAVKIGSSEKQRSVLLRSHREPTVARWHSFLWSVGVDDLDGGRR